MSAHPARQPKSRALPPPPTETSFAQRVQNVLLMDINYWNCRYGRPLDHVKYLHEVYDVDELVRVRMGILFRITIHGAVLTSLMVPFVYISSIREVLVTAFSSIWAIVGLVVVVVVAMFILTRLLNVPWIKWPCLGIYTVLASLLMSTVQIGFNSNVVLICSCVVCIGLLVLMLISGVQWNGALLSPFAQAAVALVPVSVALTLLRLYTVDIITSIEQMTAIGVWSVGLLLALSHECDYMMASLSPDDVQHVLIFFHLDLVVFFVFMPIGFVYFVSGFALALVMLPFVYLYEGIVQWTQGTNPCELSCRGCPGASHKARVSVEATRNLEQITPQVETMNR